MFDLKSPSDHGCYKPGERREEKSINDAEHHEDRAAGGVRIVSGDFVECDGRRGEKQVADDDGEDASEYGHSFGKAGPY